ncbi:hypothetical protein KC335_g37 [Hortaea werneckii]|nr:hypothetical protein KC335_g37 [Hortaea werneckii]
MATSPTPYKKSSELFRFTVYLRRMQAERLAKTPTASEDRTIPEKGHWRALEDNVEERDEVRKGLCQVSVVSPGPAMNHNAHTYFFIGAAIRAMRNSVRRCSNADITGSRRGRTIDGLEGQQGRQW